MDSITQATLGAALGEVLLARRLGNRALLWGAVIGTLPDLDVLALPLLDDIGRLGWHRGLSHSLLAVAVGTPLLTWFMRSVHRTPLQDVRARVAWFVGLDLATHVLIDCFTVYGTQVLEPFADHRVRFGNFFIIDPLFTLPLLLPLLLVLRRDPASPWRRWLPRIGLLLAACYTLLSFACKAVADARFAAAIEREGIPARRWLSSAAPLTTLYWRCLVDAGDELWIGFVSVLDPPDRAIAWERVPRNEGLLGPLAGSRAVRKVRWFSEDYFTVEREPDGTLAICDLRFSDADAGRAIEGPRRWAFRFLIGPDGQSVERRNAAVTDLALSLRHLWLRARGLADPSAVVPTRDGTAAAPRDGAPRTR